MKTVHFTKKFLSGPLEGLTYDDTVRLSHTDEFYVGKVYKEVGTGTIVKISKIKVV